MTNTKQSSANIMNINTNENAVTLLEPEGIPQATQTATGQNTTIPDIPSVQSITTKPVYTTEQVVGRLTNWNIDLGADSPYRFKWVDSTGSNNRPSITYSINTGAPTNFTNLSGGKEIVTYQNGAEVKGQATMTANQIAAARLAFSVWDDYSNLQLIEKTGSDAASADITFNYSSTTYGTGTYSTPKIYYTDTANVAQMRANQVWMASQWSSNADAVAYTMGGYGYQSALHEIGHALGLEHAGDYNGKADFDTQAVFAQDNRQFTIMSYFGGYNLSTASWAKTGNEVSYQYSQTPMVYDIAAIQSLYGADTTTRTGATTYGYNSSFASTDTKRQIYDFSDNTVPIYTIWDAGGIDTIDASLWQGNQSIDLAPGSYSSVRGLNYNVAIAFNTDIENAIGGLGNDTILGNTLANTLSGGAGADTINGGSGNDTLNGDAGADSLTGGDGNDSLDGGADVDTLVGGVGDDIYILKGANGVDTITENSNEGTDTIQYTRTAAAQDLTIAENVENLTLLGDFNGSYTGNALNNVIKAIDIYGVVTIDGGAGNDTITGGFYADSLVGGADNDSLDGGGGTNLIIDTLVGGAGNDVYFLWGQFGVDVVIENANEGNDRVQYLRSAAGQNLTLAANVENLTLTGNHTGTYTGNLLNNIITAAGTSGAVTVDGGAGNDTITGGAVADSLIGGEGNDVFDGGGGGTSIIDTLAGGAGDDAYYLWGSQGIDIVTENANEGNDSVQYLRTAAGQNLTLAANVENLTLTGNFTGTYTGNALDNIITAVGTTAAVTLDSGAGNDSMTGGTANDVLNGGIGSDTMVGGLGNDTYKVDSYGDVLVENANAGNDTADVVYNNDGEIITLDLQNSFFANIENLKVSGTGLYNLAGNSGDNLLEGNASDNYLAGNDGNDTLNGGAGGDVMAGGNGNDTYMVDSYGDVLSEQANQGNDTAQVVYNNSGEVIGLDLGNSFFANIENLTIAGTGLYDLYGSETANWLKGNEANNILADIVGGNDVLQGLAGADTIYDTMGNNLFDGGLGADLMTGGTGQDIFIGGTGNDTITTGTGYDIIVFNKGDGQDTINASTGADNTISLGGNFAYSDLSLTKATNDIILKMGATDQITLKDWYASGNTNNSILNLQVIAEAMQGFNLGGTDTLRNNKIENFNFTNLVAAFDAAGATANWQLTDARLTAHLNGGSDTAAIGGDLAYQYGKNSNLTGMGLLNAQSVMSNANFGQTAQALNNPTVWQAELVKLG